MVHPLLSLLEDAARLAEDLLLELEIESRQRAIPLLRAKAPRDYATIRREFHDNIYAAVVGYLDTNLPVTQYKNLAGKAIVEDWPEAFYSGYQEASGGSTVDAEDDAYLTGRMNAELEHLAGLFDKLKEIRKGGEFDAEAEAQARADGYCSTLDSLYGEARVRGNRNAMLTFDGEDGEESCKQCQQYKGQRHRGSWWLNRDLVRRNGNENFDCGRWGPCKHDLYRDDGQIWSSTENLLAAQEG